MEHRFPARTPLVAALAIAGAVCASLSASARDFALEARHPHAPSGGVPATVTNCDDSGPGSLRDAYSNDAAEIDLSQLTCSKITLTSGALTNSSTTVDVTLTGPADNALTIGGNYQDRVLVHNGSGTLTITSLTIAHGSYAGPFGGGCINSHGDVRLYSATVTGCQVSSTGGSRALGGAIYAYGNFSMIASEVSNGRAHAPAADSAGGAVWANDVYIALGTIADSVVSSDGGHASRGGGVYAVRDAAVFYTTLTNNTATNGGAIFLLGVADNPMAIGNSTISGNHARDSGGGVYSKYKNLVVTNTTITLNTATDPSGAGLHIASDTELESTIVAANTWGDAASPSDVGGPAGTLITGADNLVVASTLPLPPGTMALDPLLGPLRYNGGTTQTHALLPGSPAIDAGNNVAAARYDQRFRSADAAFGYERVVGPRADIGAFEYGAPDRLFADGFDGL
jgi:hypothetical protein